MQLYIGKTFSSVAKIISVVVMFSILHMYYNNHVTLPVTNIHWKLPAGDRICICFANYKALDNEDIGWKNYHKYNKSFLCYTSWGIMSNCY